MSASHAASGRLTGEVESLQARVAELEGLLRVERRRAEHLVTINEVGRRIAATLNQDDLLQQVVTLIRDRLGYDFVHVLLVEGDHLALRATDGWLRPDECLAMRFKIGEQGIVGWVASHVQPLLVNDVDRDPRFHRRPNGPPIRSEVAVPIRLGEQVLGVLAVQSAQLDVFTQHDVATLEILADQIAVALENARVYRALNQHLTEVLALQQVGTALVGERDPRRVLETVAEQSCNLVDAEMVGLLLLDAEHERLEVVVASGLLADQVMGARVPLEGSLAGQALREGGVIVSRDPATDPRSFKDMAARAEARNVLAVAMLHGDTKVGVILANNKRSGEFTERDADLLRLFGGQAAVALENARVYRAMEQHLAEVVALQQVGTAMMGERDPRRVLEEVARQTRLLLGAETVSIELLVPGRPYLEVDVASGLAATELAGMRLPIDASLSGLVVREGRVHRTANAADHPRTHKETVRRGNVSSLLVAPMGHRGRQVGTISAYNKQSGEFTERDADLMELFGSQAAVAVENARLLDAEGRRARQAEALARASITINSTLDLTATLDSISREVCDALDARRSAVFLYDPTDDSVSAGAAAGVDPALRETLDAMRMDRTHFKTFRDTWAGQTLVVDDAALDPEINATVRKMLQVRSFMATPLRVKGRYLGFLYLDQGPDQRNWTDDDRHLFEALAGPIATAVENSRLHGQAQQLAAVEERTRLARELHDSVTQSLFSASLLAQAAQSLWSRDPARARDRLDRTAELCAGALAEMRALIFELRPVAMQEEGLVSAIRKHAAARQARDGIQVEVMVEDERRLPPVCEEAAYRIVREALHNVVKHARATGVWVSLRFQPGALRIEVRDDGQGFDASAAAGRGLGLTSMRERAEALGGQLSLQSTPGVGTIVRAEMPEPRD